MFIVCNFIENADKGLVQDHSKHFDTLEVQIYLAAISGGPYILETTYSTRNLVVISSISDRKDKCNMY